MTRTTAAGLLLLTTALATPTLPAQAGDEPAFLKRQAAALHKFASQAFRAGYPSMARPIWLEVLSEYDKDHEGAREALGWVRFNTTWARKKGFTYPQGDNPGTSAARNIASKWASVARSVGAAHKKIAEEFKAAGRTDRASYHMARALRFLPDDPEVRAAMGHREFGGMSGTDVEETLFNNSRRLEAIVERERKKTYAVEVLGEGQPACLTAAGLKCAGVRSANFTIWGEWPEAELQEGARLCERALAFCKEVLVGAPSFGEKNVRAKIFLMLNGKEHYKQVIRKTPSLIPNAEQRAFILEIGAATFLRAGKTWYKGIGPVNPGTVRDACVRFVVQQYSGLKADAMTEGIGHAVVGRFLGQNRIFNVARATGTATTVDHRYLLPDMDTWGELAVETAFNRRATPAAQLPLLKASRFPTDGRIKAWSFCDYLLRRDPKLLTDLDACRGERNPEGVNQKFSSEAGLPLDALEKEWRDFWTGATPVLAALRKRQPALNMVSPGAKKWLDAFNKARAAYGVDPVRWNAGFSRSCRQHAEYLAANRRARGAEREHSQVAGEDGATDAGNVFAAMALVVTKGSPARVVKEWIHVPGYRDALINPYLKNVGLYSKGPIAVFDVVRGVNVPKRAKYGVYPPHNSRDKPGRIAVKLLPPEVQRVLQGRSEHASTIGYPITLHGWRAGSIPADVEARVVQGGQRIEGFVTTGGANRYSAAPGLAAFYPLSPLKTGVLVKVEFVNTAGKKPQRWGFTPK